MTRFFITHFATAKIPVQRRKQLGIIGGLIYITANFLLFVGKLTVGLLSGSVAVLADAFNNLSDMGASAITLAGFFLAAKKPDKKHPFGYGRVEYMAGAIVSVLIVLFGVEFIRTSITQILHPSPVAFSWIMLIVLLLAVGVKLWMWHVSLVLGREMGGSETMRATAFDSLSDVISTSVAILSLILSNFFSIPIDGYLGVVIAVLILLGGFKILLDTIRPLLGQPADKEMAEQICTLTLAYDEIVGVHDMIIHNYGPTRILATLHAEVPANQDIMFAHEAIDRAEKEIAQQLGITLLIHLDPIVIDNARVSAVQAEVKKVISEINPEYDMHDFRMLDGKKQINLIFDVLIPYGLEETDEMIIREIQEKLRGVDARYFAIITLDRSFIE